jgi:uncharacterized FAD-dependent dehydrogenase
MNCKKIIYIGAGVSTQYGVLHLLKNGYDPKKIVIIEKGDSIYNRNPSEVMSGAGGAGTYSDFKVVQSWNQGGVFTPEYVDIETATKLGEQIVSYIKEYHPDPSKIMYTEPKEIPQWLKDSPFELKQAPVLHLGTDYGRQQVQNIFEYFDKMGVIQLYNSEVIDLDFKNSMVTFISKDHYKTIIYDKIVLAGGKSGIDLLDKLIKKYNIKTTPRASQIGVRYESEGKYFEELTKFAYDFKLYKKWNDNVSGRSFCVNNFAAFVAPETTYGHITFNGHALKDPSKFNGMTNFGIMLEIKNEIDEPYEFCNNLVAFFNKDGKGASYSPTNRKPTTTDGGEVIPCYPITIEYLKEGLGPYFDYIYDFIQDLNKTFGINDDYILYVPEVKYLSNTLIINPNNFTLIDYPNVHIQGDQSVSRGIWISSISGLHVAEYFLNN